MYLARSRHRAFCVLAGFAAAYAAPATAADDKSTISSVMELVGVSSDPDARSIDYSERPRLVLPPSRGDLPPPREGDARPRDWPSDVSGVRRSGDRFARISGAGPEEKRPGFLERALSVGSVTTAPVADEPSRRMLTEPPAGYRRPTKDVSKIGDPDGKKTSWWNPMTYLGASGGEDGPVNPAASDTRGGGRSAATASGGRGGDSEGLLSSFRMPSFVRGSDKD